jgi:mannose-6-phosphate isomerase-like protein (cupin superfamily)
VEVEAGQSEDFAAFESDLPPAWDGPPPHVHRTYDEAFYVVSGSVAFSLDGAERQCPPGSFVFVPRGSVHGFGNPSEDVVKILVITSPGAIRLVESIYDMLGAGGEPDFAAMASLYADHESEIRAARPD